MDKHQWLEFGEIAQMCGGGQFRSINVASKVRSATIVAAFDEIVELRSQNKRLREVLDKVMEWYDHGISWAHGEGALEGDDYRDALDAGDAARAALEGGGE